LVLTDLDEVALAARSAELGGDERVLTVVADVRDLAAMEAAADKAVKKFGGIDVVVANAGIGSYDQPPRVRVQSASPQRL
jgi:NAD(P)-dependent dehydrogenase (short-subunit alcohol dehydrogenase family)